VRFVAGEKYPEITGCELGDFPAAPAEEEAAPAEAAQDGEEVPYEDWDDIPF
jgi:hypothetical protein